MNPVLIRPNNHIRLLALIIPSTINTATADITATVIRLFSKYAKITATKTPATADHIFAVE